MKVNVQIRKADFGKGYSLYINGEYIGYYDTVPEAEEDGHWRARKLLGLDARVVKEFEVGEDDEM